MRFARSCPAVKQMRMEQRRIHAKTAVRHIVNNILREMYTLSNMERRERTKNYEFYDASLDLNLIPIFFIDYTLALTDTVP